MCFTTRYHDLHSSSSPGFVFVLSVLFARVFNGLDRDRCAPIKYSNENNTRTSDTVLALSANRGSVDRLPAACMKISPARSYAAYARTKPSSRSPKSRRAFTEFSRYSPFLYPFFSSFCFSFLLPIPGFRGLFVFSFNVHPIDNPFTGIPLSTILARGSFVRPRIR